MEADDQLEAAKTLAVNGMAANPPWAPGMLVLNEEHPAFERIFAGTKWSNGKWKA